MPHIYSCFLFLLLISPVLAQGTTAKASDLYNEARYGEAKKYLLQLRSKNKIDFDAKHLGYLLARAAEKEGDISTAISEYQGVAGGDSVLRGYALKHLSRLARESGNLFLEDIYLTELVQNNNSKILAGPAVRRQARSLYESGEYADLNELVESGVLGWTESKQTDDRELMLLHARSVSGVGQTARAQQLFLRLIEDAPNPAQPDDISLEAVKALDHIEAGDNNTAEYVANLTAEEHEQRAEIYQFNRSFGRARLHFRAIIDRHSGNKTIPAAMYQIGRGYVQERADGEAAKLFSEVNRISPDSNLAAAALYGLAGAYANLGDTQNAVAAYEKYISENPGAQNIERAYLNIVDAYRDAGDNTRALEWTSKARSAFSGKIGASAALFAELRIYVSSEDWNRALSVINRLGEKGKLGGISIAGGTNKDEVDFLRGFILEKLGRIPEAIDSYVEIEDGRNSYYGWRSSARLAEIIRSPANANLIEVRRVQLKQKPGILIGEAERANLHTQMLFDVAPTEEFKANYRQDPQYKAPEFSKIPLTNVSAAAQILIELGLLDEAAPEVEASLREKLEIEGDNLSDFDDDTAFTLAGYYAAGGYADRAIRFIEPRWKTIPRDYRIELIPKNQARLLYPVPFRDSLIRYGKEERVDPRLILSIMRQESRFQADIKSAAAARGLMQFISGTSNKMAEELKIKDFVQNDLYSPPTAVHFGSHYLSKLFKDFPDQPQAVAASYNGGEDRMARWMKRSNSKDPDRYVPEIVFTQTKDYVYKVMSNYRMYIMLYDENLVPVAVDKTPSVKAPV